MRRLAWMMGWVLIALSPVAAIRAADPNDFLSQTSLSVNFQNADIHQLLDLIATRTGLTLKADAELGSPITLNEPSITARALLDRLSQEQQLEYSVRGNSLIVTRRAGGNSGSQGTAYNYPLHYAAAADVAGKLLPIVPPAEKLIFDERANSIIFVGSEASWQRISEVIRYLDVIPSQILIEAVIAETTDQFLQEIGVSFNAAAGDGRHTITNNNAITASPPNLAYTGTFTGIAGATLDVAVNAAVSDGKAKIISKPKVLTLNNQHAKIESGVEIHIKTLSTAITNPAVAVTSVSSGTPGLAATTGVTTLQAGVGLDIVPSIVGSNMIRMSIAINDSQPDNSTLIDGIPNINNNNAVTSILVKNGETAVLAGLIKQTTSNSTTGVPFLSDIPVLGWLFKSVSNSKSSDEIVIFITPRIDDGHLPAEKAADSAATAALAGP